VNVIYKYPIDISGLQEIELPQGARILAVQVQKHYSIEKGLTQATEEPYFWALVNTDEGRTVRRLFRIYGTGREIEERPEDLDYIGSFQRGPFIYHVFERNVSKMQIRKDQ